MSDFQFRTPITPKKASFELEYSQFLMTFGSCFSTNMGNKLQQACFRTRINPFGVLYNPISIARSIRRILNRETYSKADLLRHGDLWVSFDHHGQYSNLDAEQMVEQLNLELAEDAAYLSNQAVLFITWGSAHAYRHRETGEIVANCHKIPAREFDKEMLSVEQIETEYKSLFNRLKTEFPNLKIVLTISPIRYLSDGFFENQVSKSILHIAAQNLLHQFENVSYFPAYEIMMDDLRDYRFYEQDLIHPSKLAIDYIWNHFSATYFGTKTQKTILEIEGFRKALLHKPFCTNSPAYGQFIEKQIAGIKQFRKENPRIDLDEILAQFEKRRTEIL